MANDVVNEQGEWKKTLELHQKTLEIQVETLGEDHIDVADSNNHMASVLKDQDEWEKALALYQKALDIYSNQASGPDHYYYDEETKECQQKVADCYYHMAVALYDKGDFEKATEVYKNGVEIQVKAVGPLPTSVADSHYKMALDLQKQGESEIALAMYQKALTIYSEEANNGLYHDETKDCQQKAADCYCDMATALESQGELEKAMELYQKALKLKVKALGPEHAEVASVYNNIGYALYQLDRFDEALVECQKALDIQMKALGENHLSTAITLHTFAEIFYKQDRLEEAAQNAEKALKVYRRERLGPDSSYVADCRELMDMIDKKKSEQYLNK